jgi:hypothetical protein
MAFSITLVVGPAEADKPAVGAKKNKRDRAKDLQTLVQASSPAAPSVLTILCASIPSTWPRHARCIGSAAILTPPATASELEQKREAIAAELKKPADRKKMFARVCGAQELAMIDATGFPEYATRYRAACATQSLEKMVDALKWFDDHVESQRCRISTYPFDQEFEQNDADTWTAVSTAACATTTMTLWRTASNPGPYWSYKQIRSALPNGGERCQDTSEAPVEWHWNHRPVRPLACKYLGV